MNPAESYFMGMVNNVRALYAQISPPGTFGLIRKWVRVEAWGQLCTDEAAAKATAYHMHNRLPDHGKGWKFHKWRCEMDGPLVGNKAKLNGDAPKDFAISDYVRTDRNPRPKKENYVSGNFMT